MKPTKDLLADPAFKQFIDKANLVAELSESRSFPEQRRMSTQFVLTPEIVYEPVKAIEDVQIDGPDKNKITIRIYTPNHTTKLPIIVYFHGGGWVFGNLEDADPVCRRLANHANCIVASVEYRLAPEHPFPKPLEDCYTATQWMAENGARFGGDSKRLIVSGESAGGNLAAAVALMARDKQGPPITAQLLLYPAISSSIVDSAYDQCEDRYFLTKDSMEFFWSMYLQRAGDDKNPYASPDRARDFSGLPPAVIITAEYDPLRHEAERYADQLGKAGVKVIAKCFPGVIHGFIFIPLYEERQKAAWSEKIGQYLHKIID